MKKLIITTLIILITSLFSADKDKQIEVWVDAGIYGGEIEANEGAFIDFNGYGADFGFSYKVNPTLKIGLIFGIDTYEGDIDAYWVEDGFYNILYGEIEGDKVSLDLFAEFIHTDESLKSKITIELFNEDLEFNDKYNYETYNFEIDGKSIEYRLTKIITGKNNENEWKLKPFVDLVYWNIEVEDEEYTDSLSSKLGIDAEIDINKITLNSGLAWVHAFNESDGSNTIGNKYGAWKGAPMYILDNNDVINFNLGITFNVNDNVSINAEYTFETASDYDANLYKIGIKISF